MGNGLDGQDGNRAGSPQGGKRAGFRMGNGLDGQDGNRAGSPQGGKRAGFRMGNGLDGQDGNRAGSTGCSRRCRIHGFVMVLDPDPSHACWIPLASHQVLLAICTVGEALPPVVLVDDFQGALAPLQEWQQPGQPALSRSGHPSCRIPHHPISIVCRSGSVYAPCPKRTWAAVSWQPRAIPSSDGRYKWRWRPPMRPGGSQPAPVSSSPGWDRMGRYIPKWLNVGMLVHCREPGWTRASSVCTESHTTHTYMRGNIVAY
jgi:hypothetical protein